ncbi:MAG: hypothetical protein EON54_24575, partial [Alcaligenaceae bacterium]
MQDGKVLELPTSLYVEVARGLAKIQEDTSSLTVLRDTAVLEYLEHLSKHRFGDFGAEIKRELADPFRGIAAIDIPQLPDSSKEENFVFAAATFLTMFLTLDQISFPPDRDAPFLVHKATHSQMSVMGHGELRGITPSVAVDFHNDYRVSECGAFLPSFIGLYNEFIGYRDLGGFYWLPKASWEDLEEFCGLRSLRVSVEMRLRPAIYEAGGILQQVGLPNLRVPLIACSEPDQYN